MANTRLFGRFLRITRKMETLLNCNLRERSVADGVESVQNWNSIPYVQSMNTYILREKSAQMVQSAQKFLSNGIGYSEAILRTLQTV